MSLATPTTQAISDNIVSQIAASLSQSVPLLPKAFIRVLAKVLAGVIVLIYKYCGFIFQQLFVAYASDQPTTVNGTVIRPLVSWGRLLGVGDPLPAVQAQYTITVTVNVQSGSLASGSSLAFPGTGVIYQTVAAVPLNAPTVTVTIRAVSDQSGGDGSGIIGNLTPGDVVEFANVLPNVGSKPTVLAQVVAGADAEQTETYRARIVARFQTIPQGGAPADYQQWALEVPGIVNAYPVFDSSSPVVRVYCRATAASSGSADGIPTSGQLAAVLASLNAPDAVTGLATRRPIGAAALALPIRVVSFVVSIQGLDVAAIAKATPDIQAALTEYLGTREPYIEGLSSLPKNDQITESSIESIIVGVADGYGFSIVSATIDFASSPGAGVLRRTTTDRGTVQTVASYTLAPGEVASFATTVQNPTFLS